MFDTNNGQWWGISSSAVGGAEIWIGADGSHGFWSGGSNELLNIDTTEVHCFYNLVVDGVFSNPSDARLKQDEEPFERGLSEVLKLDPIKFRYRKNPDQLRYGLRAEEVAEIIPELVSERGPEAHKMLDVGSLSFLLINAVKELAAEVAALKGGTR